MDTGQIQRGAISKEGGETEMRANTAGREKREKRDGKKKENCETWEKVEVGRDGSS